MHQSLNERRHGLLVTLDGINKCEFFHFYRGELDGDYKLYENGVLRVKGQHKDGQKSGLFIYYDENGNKERTESFKEG